MLNIPPALLTQFETCLRNRSDSETRAGRLCKMEFSISLLLSKEGRSLLVGDVPATPVDEQEKVLSVSPVNRKSESASPITP